MLLIEFNSDMDYEDFIVLLDEHTSPRVGNRDDLEVRMEKDDLMEALGAENDVAIIGELYSRYGGAVKDWGEY